jgi:hypothetical protein
VSPIKPLLSVQSGLAAFSSGWHTGGTEPLLCRRRALKQARTTSGSYGQYFGNPEDTPLTWALAPDWLTPGQAGYLTGHNSLDYVQWMIDDDAVDLDEDGLIEKRSLWDFQEALALVLNWDK